MALSYPMDGWVVSGGAVWGTDVDEDTTTYLSAGRSLKFLSTTPATAPGMIAADFIPATELYHYQMTTDHRASSTAGGNVLLTRINWYDSTFALISSSNVFNAVVAAANTWETRSAVVKSPANTRWMKYELQKEKNAFTANFDRVEVVPAVPTWSAYRFASQTITKSTEVVVEYNDNDDATKYNVAMSTTGIVTIAVPGWYFLQARTTPNLTDATVAYIRLRINAAAARIGDYKNLPGTATAPGLSVQTMQYLARGDTVGVFVYHNNSTDRAISASDAETYFTGVQVR